MSSALTMILVVVTKFTRQWAIGRHDCLITVKSAFTLFRGQNDRLSDNHLKFISMNVFSHLVWSP